MPYLAGIRRAGSERLSQRDSVVGARAEAEQSARTEEEEEEEEDWALPQDTAGKFQLTSTSF